ncbi:MAG: hypothetical protein PW843_22660 [Azospirillaceae bacterium]|nr:hypothetical protein [Azospirillaceae bacterium]
MSGALLANLGLIALLLYSLIQFILSARAIDQDRQARERRLARLEEELGHANAAVTQARAAADGSARQAGDLEGALETLRAAWTEIDARLRALQAAPRRRITLLDKAVLVHGRLWEVAVGGNMDGAARLYLFAAATDRDARFRAEQRFPASLGFRVQRVDRFKRG